MVDGGIGCDMICMSRPPLHAVPLFVTDHTYIDDMNAFKKINSDRPHDDVIFVPFWISIFYFNKQTHADAAGDDTSQRSKSVGVHSFTQSKHRSERSAAAYDHD